MFLLLMNFILATIRYGNRAPISMGSVFARVNMLKQSCDLDEPLKFFFDICQNENPCLNGGACKSLVPNYEDEISAQHSTEIRYQCMCLLHFYGEHCEHFKFPFGFCMNGGSLSELVGLNNKTQEKCVCPEGFQGDFCEDNIDDCKNVKCSNHGVCEDNMNSYKCICFDGFYGNQCEEKSVQTVLLHIATKSFATVATLLIISIACLAIASDVHTYLTSKEQTKCNNRNKNRRSESESIEDSSLLHDLGHDSIEMNDLSYISTRGKPKQSGHFLEIMENQSSYQLISINKHIQKKQNLSPKRFALSEPTYQTLL